MRLRGIWQHGGVVFYNSVATHLPTYALRNAVLRAWGAQLGSSVAIAAGCTVLGIEALRIGDRSRVGRRCLLDARGGLALGSDVEVSDDVQFITAHHEPNSDDFRAAIGSISVEDYAWIASRSTVLEGVIIGLGSVVGACSLVRTSTPARSVVVGIPARRVAERDSRLGYSLGTRGARA